MGGVIFVGALAALGAVAVAWKMFIVVPEREKVIKERLGKYSATLKPGFHFMIPLVDRASYRQEIREQAINVPPQSCITRDNIQVEVDGIVYLKVTDAYKASYGIENYRIASINLAQTSMRSEIGKLTLDQTFSEREHINTNIVKIIDKASDPWGVKMIRYEIMNITPSRRVIDTMEKQMEAERGKRAQITLSDGEKRSKILLSEGERHYDIATSEGDQQRRVNEATGRAEEIKVIAGASAEGIREVAAAIQEPGGSLALKTQLIEQFINEYSNVLESADVRVVPQGLAELKGYFEGIGQVATGLKDGE